jgi:hypothetical protein
MQALTNASATGVSELSASLGVTVESVSAPTAVLQQVELPSPLPPQAPPPSPSAPTPAPLGSSLSHLFRSLPFYAVLAASVGGGVLILGCIGVGCMQRKKALAKRAVREVRLQVGQGGARGGLAVQRT